MYNFYQSALWNQINKDIYKKTVKEIRLWNKTYQVLVKQKKIWLISLQRYQIQGIEFGSMLSDTTVLQQQLYSIKKQLYTWWWDIFIQYGCVDVLSSFDVKQLKFKDFCDNIRSIREQKVSELLHNTWLRSSFTENMPTATIITSISKSDNELIECMWQGCRQQIKKAQSKQLVFGIANYDDREEFYDIRSGVWSGKWFTIIPKQQYSALRDFLLTDVGSLFHRGWNLFVTKLDGKIISGSIVLYDLDTMIYLYGGTDRSAGNIWSHQYLMVQIMKWGRDQWFSRFDLMWWAPTWFEHHALSSVSRFKEALGWTKIEYIGNMDLIINPLLYRIFKATKHIH